MNYRIKINDIDVTDDVVAFDGVTQQAEGDLLHSFFLDKAETTFCLAMLDKFDNIEKKEARIYFQKNLVFFGFVVSKSINRRKEEVNLTYNSFGYELGKSPLAFYLRGLEKEEHFVSDKTKEDFKERAFTTLDTEKGDTIKDMVERLVEYGYYAMKYKGFDVGQAQVDVVDNVDFIEYKSLKITEINSQIHELLGEKRKLRGVVREVDQDTSEPVNNSGYIVASGTGENLEGDLISMGGIKLIPIDANGNLSSSTTVLDEKWDYPLPGDKITYTMVNYPTGKHPYLEIDDIEEDGIYKNEVKDMYNWDNLKFQGVFWIDDNTLIIGASERNDTFAKILKIEVERAERFRYKYGQSTEISSILKDIAKVSDSILYITPDKTIKIKDRKPEEWAPDIRKEDLRSFSFSTEEYYTKSFRFPSNIKALDTEQFPIKTDVNHHYNQILNGKRTIFNYEIKAEGNEGDRMLKNQKVASIYCGIVKKMWMKGETILIESESQYPYFEISDLPNPFN